MTPGTAEASEAAELLSSPDPVAVTIKPLPKTISVFMTNDAFSKTNAEGAIKDSKAAGFEILTRGGNAFDAGVAALLVGGVVEQDLFSLGGEALVLVYPRSDGKVTAVVGQGWAPKGATIEAHGRYGDFDVTDVAGNVEITSDNAGVRLQNVGGSARVDRSRPRRRW